MRSLLILLAAAILFSACSLPCTYLGKPVPDADVEEMRRLGMDVTCP